MLVVVCSLLLAQGLPNTIQPPNAGSRMILQEPSRFWVGWWEIITIPPKERRDAFEKLPPERRSGIMRFHIEQVFDRYKGKLPHAELRALSEFSNAAVPAAFSDDVVARDKFRRAQEALLKALSRPALEEVLELLQPAEQAKALKATGN